MKCPLSKSQLGVTGRKKVWPENFPWGCCPWTTKSFTAQTGAPYLKNAMDLFTMQHGTIKTYQVYLF